MKECQNLIGARVIIYMLMGRWEQSSRVAYAGETTTNLLALSVSQLTRCDI